jgi:endonuclease/exonuclease/phosphatase (EEP) superfamily protein YafD
MKAFLKIRFLGLFSAASLLVCVATVLGFLGQWSWLCELFSHFRVQYLVGLLMLSLLLLVGKHKKGAVLCFVFALINLSCVLPLFLLKAKISPLNYPFGHHRCMLININSELGNPALVMDAVRQEQPEFLVLEEVTESWMQALSGLTNALPYFVASPREDNFGIALFSKYPLIGKNILYLGEAGVPSILASVKLDGRILEILATHPIPPISSEYASLRNEQLDRVAECIKDRSPFLLLGDLNMTPWSPYFQRFITQSGLHDSARGFGFQPSWPTHFSFLGISLDHCLHSEEIGIMNRKIGPRVGSDHFPLIVDFTLRTPL